MQNRTSKEEWFLDLAERCARQGTCKRRNYGAVIVDTEGSIISTGYTGAPSGQPHCAEFGACWREKNNVPSGSNYNKCRSVHAEMNAMLQAGRGCRCSTMYISGVDAATGKRISASRPCFLCSKMLVNSGIKLLIMTDPDKGFVCKTPEECYKEVEEIELGKLVPLYPKS